MHGRVELKEQLEEEPKKLPELGLDINRIRATEPEELKPEWFEITSIPKGRKKFKYELF